MMGNSHLLYIPDVSMGEKIPRIIHQTHYTRDLPKELEDSIDALKRNNPDWEYRFYLDADIEDFIRTEYGDDMFKIYSKINPLYGAGRADFFRYLLIYKVGGVYLDLKSTCAKPLDDVILNDDKIILAGWRNDEDGPYKKWGLTPSVAKILPSEYQQWHIISVKGHPFLKAVIERVVHNIQTYRPWRFGLSFIGVVSVTGPVAYTLAIHPILSRYPHRFVRYNDTIGLQYSIYDYYGHHKIFKNHYVNQFSPVVEMEGVNVHVVKIYCLLYKYATKTRRFIKSILLKIRACKI